MASNWSGKRIVVMGAARQGLALTRYLVHKGADVTLTDCRSEVQLADTVNTLSNASVHWVLGNHPTEILDGKDLVCLSGGVSLTSPFVKEAQARQIPLSNDSQLFLEVCPCKVIGITGSAGKTTTTALVGDMASAHMEIKQTDRKVWVGGNIGNPLIDQVDQMHEDDLAILELSSFQLELMTRSPQVAAVLNISPNHLDRHLTMEAYRAAKAHILAFQSNDDITILNREDVGSWDLLNEVKGELISFGIKAPPSHLNGTFIKRDRIYIQIGRDQIKMLPTDWISLHGQHNLLNVLAACAIAAGASISLPAIQTAIEDFDGVAHRLEFVRSYQGADWYNDSIATAPERTMAALRSFDNPVVLLLGGRDKDLPWQELMTLVRQRVNHLIVFGEVAEKILSTLGSPLSGEKPYSVTHCQGLKQAVMSAARVARTGDVVLLSPGGTSFDEFKDFEERGEWFRTWVKELS